MGEQQCAALGRGRQGSQCTGVIHGAAGIWFGSCQASFVVGLAFHFGKVFWDVQLSTDAGLAQQAVRGQRDAQRGIQAQHAQRGCALQQRACIAQRDLAAVPACAWEVETACSVGLSGDQARCGGQLP